jgi:hypothetical protein
LNSFVEVRDGDEEVARELLLGVGVGAVEHIGLAAPDANGGGGGARLQPLARGHADAGLSQGFVEGAVLSPELLLGRGGECGFVVLDQHHVTHELSPCGARDLMSRYPNDGPGSRISTPA